MIKWVCSFWGSVFNNIQLQWLALVKILSVTGSHGSFNEHFPCSIAPDHSRKRLTCLVAQPPPAESTRWQCLFSCCGLWVCALLLSAPSSILSDRKFPQSFPSQEISCGEALSKQTKSSLVQKKSAHTCCKEKKDKKKKKRPNNHQMRPLCSSFVHKATAQMLESAAVWHFWRVHGPQPWAPFQWLFLWHLLQQGQCLVLTGCVTAFPDDMGTIV